MNDFMTPRRSITEPYSITLLKSFLYSRTVSWSTSSTSPASSVSRTSALDRTISPRLSLSCFILGPTEVVQANLACLQRVV